MHKYITHGIAALVSSTLTALIVTLYGYFSIVQPLKKEAVDKGFAVWEVTNNATGWTQFMWVEYSAQEALAQTEEPLPAVR